ncbi:hypothetical protein SBW85_19575 [Vibrio plantisponsor]|uniref:Serine protease n=1 Tax=Vibrio plantisponsor TaxID=664643 RepID=A0ABU4IMV6_9VIBR|nr:hypothetical protein [Vibrio plantisponsor]MDW6019908.1 hypothetical protein [Vibrio plantisponsor]NNM38763.1 hypothetical protein [Vibrio plantisponsor]
MEYLDAIELNKVVDELVERWKGVVVPFYTNAPNSRVTYQSIGSGFVVLLGNEIYLATAHHVIDEINERMDRSGANGVISNICGTGCDLSGLKFEAIKSEDVAAAHLNREWADTKGIERVTPYNLNQDKSHLIRTEKYFVLGYPSSKNKLNEQLDKKDRHIFGYSFCAKKQQSEHTEIEGHEAFILDVDDMYSTEGEKRRPPNLDGVSGSPVFEIMCDLSNPGKAHFAVDLIGVFVEWRMKANEIVCSRIQNVVSCCLAHHMS